MLVVVRHNSVKLLGPTRFTYITEVAQEALELLQEGSVQTSSLNLRQRSTDTMNARHRHRVKLEIQSSPYPSRVEGNPVRAQRPTSVNSSIHSITQAALAYPPPTAFAAYNRFQALEASGSDVFASRKHHDSSTSWAMAESQMDSSGTELKEAANVPDQSEEDTQD